MASSDHDLSQDLIFDILSSPRRRYVLYFLRQADGPVELTTLADHVAAWENETEPSNLTNKERKRVYVSIYQTHIPKLNEAGIVVYDQETGTVALADDAMLIEEYLHEPSEGFAWYRLYLGLALISFVLLLLVAANVSVFGTIPEVIATIVVIGFLSISLAQYLSYRRQKRKIPEELSKRE